MWVLHLFFLLFGIVRLWYQLLDTAMASSAWIIGLDLLILCSYLSHVLKSWKHCRKPHPMHPIHENSYYNATLKPKASSGLILYRAICGPIFIHNLNDNKERELGSGRYWKEQKPDFLTISLLIYADVKDRWIYSKPLVPAQIPECLCDADHRDVVGQENHI